MDQSTQVNFPIVLRNPDRKMKRHLTAADIRYQDRHLSNSLNHIRPNLTRPKSVNLSTEMYQRSRICYQSESPISRLSYPISELSLREKTSPCTSINSSIATHNNVRSTKSQSPQYLDLPVHFFSSDSTSSSLNTCKCFSEDDMNGIKHDSESVKNSVTPEGLSWRRLHMSRAKLKATATTSELLSGFAMVAMVELQINEGTNVPEWLFVLFAVCTTVLVAVHIFALMISTYILPNIDAISKLDICELVSESPHERMKGFIEIAWAFSTVLGLFLFLVEVAILCWVKFWDYSFTAAIASTVIVIPVLITFVLFAVHFYHSLVVYKSDKSMKDMQKLEELKKHLDNVTSPV